MRGRPDRDRLTVWTYEQAGEEIPNGDPSVTDAERAAAGRETLEECFAAVLPGNRNRAAAQYAAAGLPDGQDIMRVWRPRDPAELRARLTEPPLAVWFSAGVVPQRISSAARSARIPHYLAAGTLEPGFRRSTRQWAERLAKAGLPCRHEEWIGGHDQKWWEQQLPVALGWLLRT